MTRIERNLAEDIAYQLDEAGYALERGEIDKAQRHINDARILLRYMPESANKQKSRDEIESLERLKLLANAGTEDAHYQPGHA